MTTNPLRVIKLGGSLFDLPDLGPRVERWRARQTPAVDVMLSGGGPLADALRAADQRHQLGEELAHWLCVQSLSITAAWCARLLPAARIVDRLDAVRGCSAGSLVVLDAAHAIRSEFPTQRSPLPKTWEVTTDSIAARLAEALGAFELVLCKSRLPENSDPARWASEGFVDAYFPIASASLPCVRAVDLRSAGNAECRHPAIDRS